jgi:hypothetical protein
MCIPSYSWRISSQRHRLERNIGSFSPNSILLTHHEFEGGRGLDMYSLVFLFSHSIRGFLHIVHTCTCIGLCPPVNDSCSFPNNTLRRASMAPRRQDPPSSTRDRTCRFTSEPPLATYCSKTMPHRGRTVPRVAIVRSRRPRSGVSPGAAPSPADICSKNDAPKRVSDTERRHHPIRDPPDP